MHTRKTHPDKSKWNLIEGETETESNTHTQRDAYKEDICTRR